MRVLHNIAQKEFDSVLMYDSIRNQLKGPVSLNKGSYVEFQWYKVLEWGDTAAIYVDVYKYPTSPSWRDNFFWPRVTMNFQWNYLMYGRLNKIENIYPNRYKNKVFFADSLQLYPNLKEIFENAVLTINPDRLFFFLKEGYFEILDRKDDYTVVAFYQPIGNIYVKNQNITDTINTMAAKVSVNEASEILIIPYNAPPELWGKSPE